jgi:hypothetical protein
MRWGGRMGMGGGRRIGNVDGIGGVMTWMRRVLFLVMMVVIFGRRRMLDVRIPDGEDSIL